ncbi:Nucleotide-binding universal stress protein, UspA family [Haladaptatus litoreus]|uniref:Nucleotide-binding universal stress protein, UspA family n=1 Tax=Haladaptatus litoreus TaxID=553468 RepID=A0A1N6XZ72_9EURY|nr:universal stress protein [Haladaptatus litoreus]SIR07618.1 Nucleotide-binding universal stress protein, UspA family [Haladaptatus litoreus]
MYVSPTPWTPSLLHAESGGQSTRRNVVVPLFDGMATDRTVEFAASLAEEWNGDVILVNPVVRPSGTQFDGSDELLDEHRKTAERVLRTALGPNTDVETRGTARVGRSLSAIVGETSDDVSAGAVVIDDPVSATQSNPLGRNVPARLACTVDCDVLTVGGSHASKTISSVLVPVSGGPHSGLAVDVARYVAQAHGAWVELLHVIETDADDRQRAAAEEYVAAARDRLGDFKNVDTWVLEADDSTDAIIEQSKYYDVTVMGAPQKGRLREFVFGSTIGEVRSAAHNTVVTVERPHERDSLLSRWL